MGLTDGLNRVFGMDKMDKIAVACLREPSLGPVFGIEPVPMDHYFH